MAMYEPLRDTVRELNRLIVDKQMYEGNRAKMLVDESMRNKLLEVRLADRKFHRNMAEQRLLLTQEDQKVQHKLQKAQTQNLLDQHKLNRRNIAEQIEHMKPKEFSVRQMMGNDDHLLENKNFVEAYVKMYGGSNLEYDPKIDRIIDKNKGDLPIKVSDAEQDDKLEWIVAIASQYENAPHKALQESQKLTASIAKLKQKIKGTDKDALGNITSRNIDLREPRFAARKAKLELKIKAKEKELANNEAFLLPESQLNYYADKEQDMRLASANAQRMGHTALAENFRKAGDEFAATYRTVWSKLSGERTAAARPGKTGPDATKHGRELIRKDFTPRTASGGFHTPNQNAAARKAEKIYTKDTKDVGKLNFDQAQQHAEAAMEEVKTLHNGAIQRFLEIQELIETNRFKSKKAGYAFLQRIKAQVRNILGYLPEEDNGIYEDFDSMINYVAPLEED